MPAPTAQVSPVIAAPPKKKVAAPLTYNGVNLTSPGVPTAPQINVSNPQSIADAVANSTNQANTANNTRYGQGLGVLTGGYNSASGLIGQAMNNTSYAGQAQRRDIRQQLVTDQGKTQQSAVSRGIGNTTILDSLQAGNTRVANNAMSDVNAQVQAQQNALLLQQANNSTSGANSIAGFIGARNDQAPDLGTYASLIQSAAANQAGDKRTATITNGSINDPINTGSGASAGYQGGKISTSIGGAGMGGGSISTAMGSGGGGSSAAAGGTYSGSGTGTDYGVDLGALGYRGAVGPTTGTVSTSAPGSSNPAKAAATPLQDCRPYNYIQDNGLTPNANGMICR